MNSNRLKEMLNTIGIATDEVKKGVFKGYSCNMLSRPIFRTWVNTRGKVTIKTRGIQKSFNIENIEQLSKELKGFEII